MSKENTARALSTGEPARSGLPALPATSVPAPSPGQLATAAEIPPPQLLRGQVLLRTLGAAEVHVGEYGVIGPGSERMFSLLAVCALSPEYTIGRSSLLDLVWADMDGESGRHSLRQHTYRLRQLGVGISSTRLSVSLARASVLPCFAIQRTAALFERDVLQGQEPFGHFFAGWIPSMAMLRAWLEDQRHGYHADVRRVLGPELRRLRDRGRWEDCERWSRTVLEFDSFNEDATVVLAEALAMMGSRSSARQLLETYVRETNAAGTELGRRMEAAQQRIMRASRVSYEGSAMTIMVGRDDVIEQLDRITFAALQGNAQVVRVSGPAGIGKTEVAHEATRRAVIQGFSRCLVRVSRSGGQITHGTLSRVARDLLKLPGSLGCRPSNLRLLRQFAGLEPTSNLAELDAMGTPSPLTECLLELITSIAEERALFLFVDDLHYADRQTLEEFERLADLLLKQQVVFLMTERGGSDPAFTSGRALARATEIELPGLGFDDRALLAENVFTVSGRHLDRDAAEQVARTGITTPLEVITLAREVLVSGMTSRLNGKLRDTLRLQLSRLTDAPRTLLSLLMLLGGKALIAELDSLLQMNIVERSAALRGVLESGLVEAHADELRAHDEVCDAMRSVLSAAELSLLRRHTTLGLLQRLRQEFVSDRAVDMLALANEGEERGLFIESVLEFAPRIADAGLLRGALRFLELARSKATDPETRARVLRCLVECADKAADWHTVVLGIKMLRDLSPTNELLDSQLGISELEAFLQTDIQLDGRAKAVRALEIAGIPSIEQPSKVRALRVAIAAASDLFAQDLAVRAIDLLEEGTYSGRELSADVDAARMQFHTVFGDQRAAEEAARRILFEFEYFSASTQGIRLLQNASHALRVCGKLSDSRAVLISLLELDRLEQSPFLLGSLFWRLSLVESDAGHKAQAIEWGEKLISISQTCEALQKQSWATLYHLRVEQMRSAVITDASLALEFALQKQTKPTRGQVYATALALKWQGLAKDTALRNVLLSQATQYLKQYGKYSGMDLLAVNLAETAEHFDWLPMATEVLRRYFTEARRERYVIDLSISSVNDTARQLILPHASE